MWAWHDLLRTAPPTLCISVCECVFSHWTGVIDAEEIKAALRQNGLSASDAEVHELLRK